MVAVPPGSITVAAGWAVITGGVAAVTSTELLLAEA